MSVKTVYKDMCDNAAEQDKRNHESLKQFMWAAVAFTAVVKTAKVIAKNSVR